MTRIPDPRQLAALLLLLLLPGLPPGGRVADAAAQAAVGVPAGDAVAAPGLALGDSAAPAPDSLLADTLALVPPPPPRDYLAEVRANFTPENRAYSGTRTVLAFVSPLYGLLVALIILFSGLAGAMRDLAHRVGRGLYLRVLAFLVLYTIADAVLALPLSYFRGYALEHQYGLSNQSLAGWFGELGKSAAVGVGVFGVVPILWLAYRAIRRWPRHWWLPVAAATLPLIVAGTLLQPLVIDPLFNTFTPLRDKQLEARIVDLAARADIPGRRVYQVDRSAQTKKYNAYVNGFGASQRIVLWDTMLEGMQQDEILFVMGHEMGHYKLGHIWKGIGVYSALSFALFFLTARIAGWAARSFGGRWGFREVGDVASLPLLVAVTGLLMLLAQPAINGLSRGIEHEADVFALEVTRDNDAGARAFLALGSQNRSNPEPAPAVRFFLYTHPPLIERIRFAQEYRPWQEGRPNRLFRGPGGGP